MKALSLMEPWATFMALGLKTVETRSWVAHYRGEVMIHASKSKECLGLANEILARAGLELRFPEGHPWPLGKIVAVVDLSECLHTGHFLPGKNITVADYCMGDYSSGRFGFRTRNLWKVPEPVECRGALGFWLVPAEIAQRVLAQRKAT